MLSSKGMRTDLLFESPERDVMETVLSEMLFCGVNCLSERPCLGVHIYYAANFTNQLFVSRGCLPLQMEITLDFIVIFKII